LYKGTGRAEVEGGGLVLIPVKGRGAGVRRSSGEKTDGLGPAFDQMYLAATPGLVLLGYCGGKALVRPVEISNRGGSRKGYPTFVLEVRVFDLGEKLSERSAVAVACARSIKRGMKKKHLCRD